MRTSGPGREQDHRGDNQIYARGALVSSVEIFHRGESHSHREYPFFNKSRQARTHRTSCGDTTRGMLSRARRGHMCALAQPRCAIEVAVGVTNLLRVAKREYIRGGRFRATDRSAQRNAAQPQACQCGKQNAARHRSRVAIASRRVCGESQLDPRPVNISCTAIFRGACMPPKRQRR